MKKALRMLAAILTICGSFMFTACSTDNNAEEEGEFRTMLKSLDWGTDTTFVYGHKTPDVDAVCSSLSYARLMRTLGYNCKAKVSGAVNRETEFIANLFGFALPDLKSNVIPQTRLILTDHSEYAQSVDGAKEAVILQEIDHHAEGDIPDSIIPYVRREMIGATCTIIYEMYRELGVEIDDETARILLAGLLSDTRNLTKATTQYEDSVAWVALVTQLHLEDRVDEISRQMSEASNNYYGMSDIDIFLSDYKEYDNIGGKAIGIGSLDCKASEMEDFINRMLAVMPQVMNDKNLDMLFAKIDNKVPNPDESNPDDLFVDDGTYFIYCGEGSQTVADSIIGPSLREGVAYSKEKISRRQIVTMLTELMERLQ
ncbi:MAG: DHH family phosphoesterase [Bacteroidaceae bacterium]|nr:DHH family phosphoesterase [Bacteroidaceae bacterium]